MLADRFNPLGPELALGNLCECGPRSPRAAPGPALRLGGRRGGVWRSGAARGVGGGRGRRRGGQCTEGCASGRGGPPETRVEASPGPGGVSASDRPPVSSPKSCSLPSLPSVRKVCCSLPEASPAARFDAPCVCPGVPRGSSSIASEIKLLLKYFKTF